ncbi:MAG: hypothetical protein ABI781_21190 [Burkholderiales bacterium]
MKTWWADTLFKRLFLLMWFGLVASHLLAFVVTMRVHAPPDAAAPGIDHRQRRAGYALALTVGIAG